MDNNTDEVYDLPRGTRIYNNDASQDLALKTAEAVARGVLNESRGSGGGDQNITINSPRPLNPSETARQFKQASRELALDI